MTLRKKMYIVLFSIGICVALAIALLVFRQPPLDFSMHPLPIAPETLEVNLQGVNLISRVNVMNSNESGLYVSRESDFLEILYQPLDDENAELKLLYQSNHPSIAYQTYVMDNSVLVLELFMTEHQTLAFRIIDIRYEPYRNSDTKLFSSVTELFSDECERMPYLSIADLSAQNAPHWNPSGPAGTNPRILLNYDRGGTSHLVLLSDFPGYPNIVVAGGAYDAVAPGIREDGKRILFCGGYGAYIYYQAVYNRVGDPPPDVASFEATGTPILFRYHITDETIERVADPDHISLHMNGTRNLVILSEYDYHAPLKNSGKIIQLTDARQVFTIPGIESGVDILGSRFLSEEQLVLYSPSTLYFFDTKTKKAYTYPLEGAHGIQLGSDGVSFISNGQESHLTLHFVRYRDVFTMPQSMSSGDIVSPR